MMNFKFKYYGNYFWTLEIDNLLKIGCDPYLLKEIDQNFKDVHCWFITENSKHHFNDIGSNLIANTSKIIARKEAGKLLWSHKNSNISFLNWFNKIKLEIKGYTLYIEAVPCYKGNSLLSKSSLKKVNGYLITIIKNGKSKTVYITGDTVYNKTIVNHLAYYVIDIIIANVSEIKANFFSGANSMDLPMLNTFIQELKPKTTIPLFRVDPSLNRLSNMKIVKINEEIIF